MNKDEKVQLWEQGEFITVNGMAVNKVIDLGW